MTPEQMAELIDLYVTDDLPLALKALVEEHLAAHPDASRDAETLRASIVELQRMPLERPDSWFTERLLAALLREQAGAPATAINQ